VSMECVGFSVAVTSCTYAFRVIDPPDEIRQFTVKVQLEAFRSTRLKLHNGPGICFARLKRELDGETPELRAATRLDIGEQDIQEYLERRYPGKRS